MSTIIQLFISCLSLPPLHTLCASLPLPASSSVSRSLVDPPEHVLPDTINAPSNGSTQSPSNLSVSNVGSIFVYQISGSTFILSFDFNEYNALDRADIGNMLFEAKAYIAGKPDGRVRNQTFNGACYGLSLQVSWFYHYYVSATWGDLKHIIDGLERVMFDLDKSYDTKFVVYDDGYPSIIAKGHLTGTRGSFSNACSFGPVSVQASGWLLNTTFSAA